MAGNKTVPLTWGPGGPKIGSASVDENGIITAEVEYPFATQLHYNDVLNLSIFTREKPED